MSEKVRHILSLSGGKDSAALALYMRDRVPEMEYIFHDTGEELPETYLYLSNLASKLGLTNIQRTRPDYNFRKWLEVYGGMVPSMQRRWCTRLLKLKPFEDFVGNEPVINYVGIRADEERVGYISHKPNIKAVYPFREDGLVKADIIRILEESGLGLPTYSNWGRTRSGCYFCFYQQKIEWVGLKEVHPDLFAEAKKFEYANKKNGNAFYWNDDESLEEIEQPERMAEIKQDWEEKQKHRKTRSSKLVHILGALEDDEEEEREGCLICQI